MKVLALSLATIGLGVAFAHADPLEDRENLMKERGAQMRILGPIAQEQQPFDAAAVMAALEVLQANAQKGTDIDALWPEGSQGGDSADTIWSDREGFQAASDKFAADVDAAVAAAPADLAAFRTVFGPVASNCGTCHETYRTD